MEYIVTINYTKFSFDNSEEAMIFATTAKRACVSKRCNDDPVEVSIEIVIKEDK